MTSLSPNFLLDFVRVSFFFISVSTSFLSIVFHTKGVKTAALLSLFYVIFLFVRFFFFVFFSLTTVSLAARIETTRGNVEREVFPSRNVSLQRFGYLAVES